MDPNKIKYSAEDIQKNRTFVSAMSMNIKEEFRCQVEGCDEHACWIDGMKDNRECVLLCFAHNTKLSLKK